jgi:hypothetical protein
MLSFLYKALKYRKKEGPELGPLFMFMAGDFPDKDANPI